MVAKIIRSESLYGALIYNQKKLDERSARIIGDHKMVGDIRNSGENVIQKAIFSFKDYLSANRNTAKPILHISLNPSPEDSLTDPQFATLAHDYMDAMYYGDQPYIVYLHEDTGRRHIHIVTTCVNENGRKINDKYEYRRSMQACRELEQKYGLKNAADSKLAPTEPYLKKVDYKQGNVKRQIANTLKSVLVSYKFQSFGEYTALLACYNVEVKQVKGEYDGKPYSGIVYTATDEKGHAVGPPFKSSLFGKQFGHEGLTKKMNRHAADFKNRKWSPKIHDTVALGMRTCGSKQKNFEKILKNKGIDVLFRTNDDGRIYGVTFIDHRSREVYNGSRLGKEFSANTFERLFNEPAQQIPQQLNPDHESKESVIEQAFGLFHFEPGDGRDFEEEAFARRMKRKKKKKRSQGLS